MGGSPALAGKALVSATTDKWKDGSMVKDYVSLMCAAGAGFGLTGDLDTW